MGLALLTEAAAGLLLVGVLAAVLLARERKGWRLTALHLVLVILVLDCALFPSGGTSTGVFVLPVNNRTTGVLALLMPFLLALRWLSGKARPRVTLTAVAWGAFFLWLLAEFYAGRRHGNPFSFSWQEAKVIVMLGAPALLAAGVEARDLVGPRGVPLMVRWSAPIAAVLTLTSLAGVDNNSSFGLFHGVDTGQLGADAASVFASLGMLGLCVALSAPARHRRGLLASGVLLIAPAFTGQRASLLGLVFGLALIVVWPLVSKNHRVLRVTARDKVAVGLAILAIAGVYSLAAGTGHGYNFGNSSVATSFTSAGKADSAQSRLNQWAGARKLIAERPWLGWGLGKHFVRVEKIEDAPLIKADSDLSHDIFLDVLLRSGIVGLSFLVLALGCSIAVGLRAARRLSPRIVALGLAASAVIVGMIVRGAVESIFEKERLAVLLGLGVGIACSAGRVRHAAPVSEDKAAPLTVPADWYPQLQAAGSPMLVGTGPLPRNDN